MPRILFFVFLAFLVWLAVRVVGSRRSRGAAAPPAAARSADVAVATERILQCAWCGVHVPVGSAVALPDGRTYCGAAHRTAAQSAAAGRDAS